MRDILIHEYFGIILERTWKAIEVDMFELKENILQISQYLEKK